MNKCFALAVDPTQPNRPHTEVRVYGHGALLGTLILRNEEVECLKQVFYPSGDCFKVGKGQMVKGETDRRLGLPTVSTWAIVAREDLLVRVEPEWKCQFVRED